MSTTTRNRLDRAILAYRADPSVETHAALIRAEAAHVDSFYQEQAADFIARTTTEAGARRRHPTRKDRHHA